MQRIILATTWILSSFLLFFKLSILMPFIGDQAWFYLSARDILLFHKIPLVGITSSHTWLHQGPLWTYVLALIFALTKFNPIIPGYVTAGITLLTAICMFFLGRSIFSKNTAFWGSIFFATSPLVILNGRMPFCTALIPLFALFFVFTLYKLLANNSNYLPFCFLVLAILYNLEIATSIYLIMFIGVLFFGIIRQEAWLRHANKKICIASLITFVIPMIPMFLYDTNHGFPQTIKYPAWLILHVSSLIIPIHILAQSTTTYTQMFYFLGESLQKTVFLPSFFVAIIFFVLCTIFFVIRIFRQPDKGMIILGLCVFVPFLALIASKTPSEAYIPMVFVPLCFFVGKGIEIVSEYNRFLHILTILLVLVFVIGNSISLVQNNYFMRKGGYGIPFAKREEQAMQMIQLARDKPFTIKGAGPGSEFSSFTMNYDYLTWYLGHSQSTRTTKQIFTVSDDGDNLIVHLKNR